MSTSRSTQHPSRRLPRRLVLLSPAALVLAGCGTDPDGTADDADDADRGGMMSGPATADGMPGGMMSDGSGHEHMMDGGPVPAGMTPAPSPTFAPGSEVVLTAGHMPGMEGARARVVGAYRTTTYAVDYSPTTGGPEVTDHKWVVHEELQDAGPAPLAPGTPVTITANHMPGMQGAKGRIVSSTDETVYQVDVEMNGGMTMRNHKWMVESEMRPAS
ncbi:YdhK family protein [Brachybacterium sp. EF45031]|uniref:YdhK family protein n=1 Tax=Brachybacterium sillae TaxID=2810536 RepID=UPI00217EDB48|nr:YdhK family protein [Brachybacterium sillae]MCS6711778.1 YdhK family protein [Brachybacterium sillae]